MMVIITRREVVWITSEDLNLTKSIKGAPTDGRKSCLLTGYKTKSQLS